MHPQVSILVKLQDLDLSIEKIGEAKESYPKRIELLKVKLDEERKLTDLKRENLENLEKKRRKDERTLEDKMERIKKSEEKLLSVKTNREYQAAKREIALTQEANSKKEENILNILEEIDVLREELKKKEEYFRELSMEFEKEKNELTKKLDKFEKQLGEKIKTRGKLSSKVDPERLKMYENIKKRRHGIAVVSTKDGSCQGCYMDIPPQLYNEVQRGTDLLFCPNCNRIFYWANNQ